MEKIKVQIYKNQRSKSLFRLMDVVIIVLYTIFILKSFRINDSTLMEIIPTLLAVGLAEIIHRGLYELDKLKTLSLLLNIDIETDNQFSTGNLGNSENYEESCEENYSEDNSDKLISCIFFLLVVGSYYSLYLVSMRFNNVIGVSVSIFNLSVIFISLRFICRELLRLNLSRKIL